MVNKTSISAIRALLFLAHREDVGYVSPRRLAESLGESPTYMAKVVRHLVKNGILDAEKGVKGGVSLVKNPSELTLLQIVEACQGVIVGDYCRGDRPEFTFCNFHRAAAELHTAITGVLAHWTLAQLLEKPAGGGDRPGVPCLMGGGRFPARRSTPPPPDPPKGLAVL